MSGTSLPDPRLKYWTIHETACWFADETPDYVESWTQVLGPNSTSAAGKLYRLLKDATLDGNLRCIPIGWVGHWRLRPYAAIQWAQSVKIPIRPELVEMVAAQREQPNVDDSPTASPKDYVGEEQVAPAPLGVTILKRDLILDRLEGKYPKLRGAMTTNDEAFRSCRVPPEHTPGKVTQGYYYLEMVESVCQARWSPETPLTSTPPTVQRLGKF